MIALWRWPCALLALLLSGFGGLRALPADERAADEAERVVVSRPAPTDVVVLPQLARAGWPAWLAPRLGLAIVEENSLVADVAGWRPAPSQLRGSAGGPRAP